VKVKQKMRKRILVSGMIILLMFTSFLLVVPVIANDDDDDDNETSPPEEGEDEETDENNHDDHDDDGVDDEEEEINERELSIEVSGHKAKIESEQKLGETKNKFKIELEVPEDSDDDDGVKFKLEFSSDSESLEIELEFKVVLYELVEYIDTNSDGIYNASEDQLIQTYILSDFLPIVYSTENISGNIVHILDIQSTDGVFTSRIFASGEFALINDNLISPVELKIDIGIHNFAYQESTSALALKVKLESEGEKELDDETEDEQAGHATNEKEVEVSMGDFTGFFSWVETAMVDGVEKQVKVTPLEIEDGEQKLYLNYPRGNEIIHDPKIGVANILQQVQSPFGISNRVSLPVLSRDGFLLISAISALTVIGIVAIARNKVKKKFL